MKKPPKFDPDWEDEIADIEPLKNKTAAISQDDNVDDWDDLPPAVGEGEFARALDENIKEKTKDLVQEQIFPETKPTEEFKSTHNTSDKLSGERVSIDPKVRKKLSRGEIEFTRYLDLHGYYFDEAYDALMDFLNESQEQGHRCVLIIHGKGKGYGEGGKIGLIKSKVPEWLQGNSAVLAYHTAKPKHGGSGAAYVLLRRKR